MIYLCLESVKVLNLLYNISYNQKQMLQLYTNPYFGLRR